MAEMGTAPIAATGARGLSSQLQSSFATGSRMHGGREDALMLPPLVADPPPPVDPPVDADLPVDADPAAEPYPFVFGPTGTWQKVAVISSMQKVPVVGACDGPGGPLCLPDCGVFGAAIRSWAFDVPTCAETGDTAGNTIAISATTNATFFMCAAICFMDAVSSWTPFPHGRRFLMDANVFIVPCPSPYRGNMGGARTHVVGGNFLQAPMSGE